MATVLIRVLRLTPLLQVPLPTDKGIERWCELRRRGLPHPLEPVDQLPVFPLRFRRVEDVLLEVVSRLLQIDRLRVVLDELLEAVVLEVSRLSWNRRKAFRR